MPPSSNPDNPSYSNPGAFQSPPDGDTSSQESESDGSSAPTRVFIEYYPNNQAGAPIDIEPLDDFDLAAYIGSCGPFADPKIFRAAELLVASNLTNAQKTEFLESELVSNISNV